MAFRVHFVFVYVLTCFSHVRLCDCHGSSVHEIPGENSGVSCRLLTPGDLPDPEIETGSLALQVDSSPSEPPRKLRSIQQGFIPYVPGVSWGCLGGIGALGWDCSLMRGQLAFGCYKLASVGVTRVTGLHFTCFSSCSRLLGMCL